MQKIVSVKKYNDKNLYLFKTDIELNLAQKVVVEFEDFQTIGEVVKLDVKLDDDKAIDIPKIIRVATEKDITKHNQLIEKAKINLVAIKKKSLDLGLIMKFVSAEYSLDNSKILIVFSSEERVDFRQFLKDLAVMLKTRIELKQIGQRDEVKIIGGVGPCGQPCCCARFLKDFEHVTVKMAKNQGLSLSPTKINGICGRLMCCLGYEAQTYDEILAKMPKINSEVTTPKGKGIVVYNDILRERVSVKRAVDNDSFVVEDFDLEEINNNKFKDIKKDTQNIKESDNKKKDELENFEKKEELDKKSSNTSTNADKKPFNKKEGFNKNKFHKKDKFKNNKK